LLHIRRGNYLQGFVRGLTFVHPGARTITEGDRSLYIGLTGSRSVLNVASTTAIAAGLRASPIEDMLVFNIVFGKSVADISMNAVANLGYADVRFHRPVYPADTLTVVSEVLGVKENADGKRGVVHVRTVSKNQHGEIVLSYIRWVMVHKDAHCDRPVLASLAPALPTMVPFDALTTIEVTRPSAIFEATQCSEGFEAYEGGDRIDHPGAMTINDSDHSIATRLYQNNARAHFDGFNMERDPMGTRLVYGGHIISICRALSYDGLENCLGILAINAGRHLNPTFAGDTIRCASQVLDVHTLSSEQGAIRLRMLAAKNVFSSADIAFPAAGTNDGSARDHPQNIVLDLDYTLAMARATP
jgi:2-methylfumaryl-CoA hydratase